MHQAGVLGIEGILAGQVVVEGVVHQQEGAVVADFLDRAHRHRLVAQRAFLEAQRLDQADQTVRLQDRAQAAQRGDQIGVALLGAAAVFQAIERAHHQRLGAAGLGVAGQLGGLRGALGVEDVERVERVDRADRQAVGPGDRADIAGGHAVAQLHAGQVVADLDGAHAQAARHRGELGQAQARCADAVDGEVDRGAHGQSPCVGVGSDSRSRNPPAGRLH